jgi:hypothetical protein
LSSAARILARLLVLSLALGATAGCATSFLYERADRLANRWVNGYVDLEPAQQARLEAGFTELHEWHRREHLPAYAAWLRGIALRLGEAQPVSAEELQLLGEELGEFWRELADRALPALVEVGAGLDDDQVAALLASLREERDKELREAARRADAWHQQRRARSMERFLKRWTGPLSAGQRQASRPGRRRSSRRGNSTSRTASAGSRTWKWRWPSAITRKRCGLRLAGARASRS